MSGADIEMLAARVAALEAKIKDGTRDLNTTDLMSFPEVDVDTPPIVPIGGGNEGIFAWDSEKKQIKSGYVTVGRTQKYVPASSEGLGDHGWAICVTFTNDGATAEHYQFDSGTIPSNTDTVTYLPLYKVVDGEMVEDWRGNFIVLCWD